MRPRSRLPAGRASSLTRTPERSLARRRLARRSCISSVVAARADVRRIRQRRLAPSADSLAKTEEAAEAKLVKKHMAELAKARLESKPKFVDSPSTRCASQSRPSCNACKLFISGAVQWRHDEVFYALSQEMHTVQPSLHTAQAPHASVAAICGFVLPVSALLMVCNGLCSAPALKDSVTSLIDRLGNTKVLSREVEGRLTRIIRKGVQLQEAVAALEVQLQRLPSVSEILEMQVGANPSHDGQLLAVTG